MAELHLERRVSPVAAYYNEHNAFAAAWLRNLIGAGAIAAGDVDERDVRDVQADDLRGYEQCHFFAGIGGWSLALRIAGWPDERPVWTGSCPCQPFSGIGRRRGTDDERHLWPDWHSLIAECRPPAVFGEQVAGGTGLEWLGHVRADLEATGYAVGAANIPACGVGAHHKRERLWFVAVGDTAGERWGWRGANERREARGRAAGATEGLERWSCADGKFRPIEPGIKPLVDAIPGNMERLRGYGNAIVPEVAAVFVRASMEGANVEVRGGGALTSGKTETASPPSL